MDTQVTLTMKGKHSGEGGSPTPRWVNTAESMNFKITHFILRFTTGNSATAEDITSFRLRFALRKDCYRCQSF
jgi:hypothetical protein